MGQPVLGILTLYLNEEGALEERPVYQKMTLAGKSLGLEVFVFTPKDVNYKQNRINAMVYNPETKSWSRKWRSFPHLIYDRCRIQRSKRFDQLLHFRRKYGHLTFLNRVLRNKWTVYKTMRNDERFRDNLPATKMYERHQDLIDMLRKYPIVYLKPVGGTGGRGILRIERHRDGMYLIQGRDQSRKIISPQRVPISSLQLRLSSWDLKNKRYLVQQGIQLKLANGRVHDYRMLVQKNGDGVWDVTGCAGRIGAPRSVTSNLHGGGEAISMRSLLEQWLGDYEAAGTVMRAAEKFGVETAAFLEQSYGRLCELALDLAIDRKGHIWLLEVNPKPAREVFKQAGEKETYRRAITRPLEYAVWLYGQKQQRKELLTRRVRRNG